MIVGQVSVRNHLKALYAESKPTSILFQGIDMSQMQAIVEELAETYAITLINIQSSVEDIRGMIEHAYKHKGCMYVVHDAGSMSNASKNAMLKVIEEPPNDASFVLLVENEQELPTTIASRSHVIVLAPYTRNDLQAYCNSIMPEGFDPVDADEYVGMVDTPSEIDIIMRGPGGMIDYVKNVVNRMGDASLPNTLKIGVMVSTKADDGKWDMYVFIKALRSAYYNSFRKDYGVKKNQSITILSKAMNQLGSKSVNKVMLFDSMLIELWRVWSK